jgi:hypothetical protein
MKGFSFIGLLAVIAIIAYSAKSYLQPPVSHDPNNRTTVEYWVAHTADRTAMISFCGNHPDKQGSGDCALAIQAQTQVDAQGSSANSTQGNTTGVDQASGEANDQLQAQQNANTLDQGSP